MRGTACGGVPAQLLLYVRLPPRIPGGYSQVLEDELGSHFLNLVFLMAVFAEEWGVEECGGGMLDGGEWSGGKGAGR